MKRSSPVNLKLLSTRDPALMANAARYSPAGQPSVRSTSSSTRSSASATPAPGEQRPSLRSAHREVVDPDLHDAALGRRSDTGTGTSRRDPIASCEPAGSRSASSAMMSRHAWLVSASAWSITTATGRLPSHAIDATNGGRCSPGRRPATPTTGTPSDRSARRDRRPRRDRSRARSGRCRERPPTATPPAVACARPIAPTRSSCRSPPVRRRRAPRAGARRRDARRARCARRCPGGPAEDRAWTRPARTRTEVVPGDLAVTRKQARAGARVVTGSGRYLAAARSGRGEHSVNRRVRVHTHADVVARSSAARASNITQRG